MRHQNIKMSIYKVDKNHWVTWFFCFLVPVRKIWKITVALDHPVFAHDWWSYPWIAPARAEFLPQLETFFDVTQLCLRSNCDYQHWYWYLVLVFFSFYNWYWMWPNFAWGQIVLSVICDKIISTGTGLLVLDLEECFFAKVEVLVVLVGADQLETNVEENSAAPR